MRKREVLCICSLFFLLVTLSFSYANTLILNSTFQSGDDVLLDGASYKIYVTKGGEEMYITDGDEVEALEVAKDGFLGSHMFRVYALKNITSQIDTSEWHHEITMAIFKFHPDVAIASVFDSPVFAGQEVTYNLSLANKGNETATQVDFELIVPDGFSLFRTSKCTKSGSIVKYAKQLLPGENVTCRLYLTPTGDPGRYDFDWEFSSLEFSSFGSFNSTIVLPITHTVDLGGSDFYRGEAVNLSISLKNNYTGDVNISDFFVYVPESFSVYGDNLRESSGLFYPNNENIAYKRFFTSYNDTGSTEFVTHVGFYPQKKGTFSYYYDFTVVSNLTDLLVNQTNGSIVIAERNNSKFVNMSLLLGQNVSEETVNTDLRSLAGRNESFILTLGNSCYCNFTNFTLRGFMYNESVFSQDLGTVYGKTLRRFSDFTYRFPVEFSSNSPLLRVEAEYEVDGETYVISKNWTIRVAGLSEPTLSYSLPSKLIAGTNYTIELRGKGNEVGGAIRYVVSQLRNDDFIFSGFSNRTMSLPSSTGTLFSFSIVPKPVTVPTQVYLNASLQSTHTSPYEYTRLFGNKVTIHPRTSVDISLLNFTYTPGEIVSQSYTIRNIDEVPILLHALRHYGQLKRSTLRPMLLQSGENVTFNFTGRFTTDSIKPFTLLYSVGNVNFTEDLLFETSADAGFVGPDFIAKGYEEDNMQILTIKNTGVTKGTVTFSGNSLSLEPGETSEVTVASGTKLRYSYGGYSYLVSVTITSKKQAFLSDAQESVSVETPLEPLPYISPPALSENAKIWLTLGSVMVGIIVLAGVAILVVQRGDPDKSATKKPAVKAKKTVLPASKTGFSLNSLVHSFGKKKNSGNTPASIPRSTSFSTKLTKVPHKVSAIPKMPSLSKIPRSAIFSKPAVDSTGTKKESLDIPSFDSTSSEGVFHLHSQRIAKQLEESRDFLSSIKQSKQ